jgi:hypothetical protein
MKKTMKTKTENELADCRATFDATVERMRSERDERIAALRSEVEAAEAEASYQGGGRGFARAADYRAMNARAALAQAERGQCGCGAEMAAPQVLEGMTSALPWQYKCADCLNEDEEARESAVAADELESGNT